MASEIMKRFSTIPSRFPVYPDFLNFELSSTHTYFSMEVTVKTAKQLRLTEEEFELIKQKLGRTPNFNELCAFSGMWSEHCSYKNSIKWLKTLPREGEECW